VNPSPAVKVMGIRMHPSEVTFHKAHNFGVCTHCGASRIIIILGKGSRRTCTLHEDRSFYVVPIEAAVAQGFVTVEE
jgi:hypothetical protein